MSFQTISESICSFVWFVFRNEEKKRQQRLLAEQQKQRRQQPARRPSFGQSADWFGNANQNLGHDPDHGHGHDHAHRPNSYAPAQYKWTPGFDASTTARGNFDETPQTFRAYDDAPAAAASRQQYLDPFATMHNRY